MTSESNSSSSGIGFYGLLAVLFIGLKLTGHIDWSWWFVLGPLWMPLVVLLALAAIFMICTVGGMSVGDYLANRRRKRIAARSRRAA